MFFRIHMQRLACFMLVVCSLAVVEIQAGENSASSDEQAVLKVNAKFYAALNAMLAGDAKPFAEVWWHTDDVIYMGADGAYNVGWDQTYANWKRQAELKIGGKVMPKEINVNLANDSALVTKEVVQVGAGAADSPNARLRATSVFRKQDGQWKLISHHVDVIPQLRNRMAEED